MVGDTQEDIEEVLREAGLFSDLVVITGGLGPTEDDRTRFAVSKIFKKKLILREDVEKSIKEKLEKFGVSYTESNRSQALIPEDAFLLENPIGTAPGFFLYAPVPLVTLPGVPREVEVLWPKVEDILKDNFRLKPPYIKVFYVCGISESKLNERLGDIWDSGVEIGVRIEDFGIRVRLKGKKELVEKAFEKARERIGSSFLEEELRSFLGKLLKGRIVEVYEDQSTGGAILAAISSLRAPSRGFVEGPKGRASIVVRSRKIGKTWVLETEVDGKGRKREFLGNLNRYVAFVLDSLRRDITGRRIC